MSGREFYLVQRLRRRDLRGQKGFDGFFGCEYMGSAEFEWGAIPDSLKRVRAARRLAIHEGVVTRHHVTVPVFVVGNKKTIATVPERLTAWMIDEHPWSKEWSYFPEKVEGTAKEWHRADAWWALNEDVLWTLDEAIAADLLRAVQA